MDKREHLKLPVYRANIERLKRGGGGGFPLPAGRNKETFYREAIQKAENLIQTFSELKQKFSGNIDPSLIYEIEINQSVHTEGIEDTLSSMGIYVLSVAEGKKGFWIVFNDNDNLDSFKRKLADYGSEEGPKYDFFNAIESFQNIPIYKKIGQSLKDNPLGDKADFIDIELWKMRDLQKNKIFIEQLKNTYNNFSEFRITDKLVRNSFVLLRVKLTKIVFDEIIELNEIARADRPSLPYFNQFEYARPDISEIVFNEPDEDATGILVIDSGVISNHPMLEKCIGGEENFQSGEIETHDTVGHGTAVAGCAAYGNIEDCLKSKGFNPGNWIFSAKVMYAEINEITGVVSAAYDPEKLIEHQFEEAVESFLSKPEYHIKVVNISLGNSNEVWHKHYSRQLPLAALIDELAVTFPHVTFIVSAGNQNPMIFYDNIKDIIDDYPNYLIDNNDFNVINPATSALALTVGSIADTPRININNERYGAEEIKTPVASKNHPSPFTRTGAGINGMIKPELVEYGGNLILLEKYGRIVEDIGGKIALLSNKTTENIIKFDYGTSYSAPKIAHIAGIISNKFPQKSANFIKNMLLIGADYPFLPTKQFYNTSDKSKAELKHLFVNGFGLSNFDKAINSFDNRIVLWDDGQIGLNQIKVYSLHVPDIFFSEPGKKKITVVLTFNPETRLSRGDSYLGNRMEFHMFHSVEPQCLIEKYGEISEATEKNEVPEGIEKFEIEFFPGSNTRKAGCHQKAWKEYKREPKNRPATPITLVLLNFNKWISDGSRLQDYCVSVTFEHEKEIELYNQLKINIQTRARLR